MKTNEAIPANTVNKRNFILLNFEIEEYLMKYCKLLFNWLITNIVKDAAINLLVNCIIETVPSP